MDAGLFTEAQLIALGAVTPTISAPPQGQEGLGNMFTFDLKLGWKIRPLRARERLTIEPQVSIYNLFNRQNFDSPSQPLSGILSESRCVAGLAPHGPQVCDPQRRAPVGSSEAPEVCPKK